MAETLNTLLNALVNRQQQGQALQAHVGQTNYNDISQTMAMQQAEDEQRKKQAQSIGYSSKMAGEPEGTWTPATPELGTLMQMGATEATAKQRSIDASNKQNKDLANIAGGYRRDVANSRNQRPAYDYSKLKADQLRAEAEIKKIQLQETNDRIAAKEKIANDYKTRTYMNPPEDPEMFNLLNDQRNLNEDLGRIALLLGIGGGDKPVERPAGATTQPVQNTQAADTQSHVQNLLGITPPSWKP